MAWKDEVARDMGKLISAHVSVMRRDGIPGRSAFLDRALTGGGPGVDLLPHALAVVADVTGMLRPSTVVGLVHPPQAPGANTVEDAAYGTFVFEDGGDWVVPGAQLTVATSWRASLPAGDPDERWTIRLIGTEGGFEIVLPTGPVAAQAGYDAEIGLYVARVRDVKPISSPSLELQRSTALGAGAESSARPGRRQARLLRPWRTENAAVLERRCAALRPPAVTACGAADEADRRRGAPADVGDTAGAARCGSTPRTPVARASPPRDQRAVARGLPPSRRGVPVEDPET